jgi:hypothetical protein
MNEDLQEPIDHNTAAVLKYLLLWELYGSLSALGTACLTLAGSKTFVKPWAVVILCGTDVASADAFTWLGSQFVPIRPAMSLIRLSRCTPD